MSDLPAVLRALDRAVRFLSADGRHGERNHPDPTDLFTDLFSANHRADLSSTVHGDVDKSFGDVDVHLLAVTEPVTK